MLLRIHMKPVLSGLCLFHHVKDGSHVRLWHPSCVYFTAHSQYTVVQKMRTPMKSEIFTIIVLPRPFPWYPLPLSFLHPRTPPPFPFPPYASLKLLFYPPCLPKFSLNTPFHLWKIYNQSSPFRFFLISSEFDMINLQTKSFTFFFNP